MRAPLGSLGCAWVYTSTVHHTLPERLYTVSGYTILAITVIFPRAPRNVATPRRTAASICERVRKESTRNKRLTKTATQSAINHLIKDAAENLSATGKHSGLWSI